jgi:hypothetical protein
VTTVVRNGPFSSSILPARTGIPYMLTARPSLHMCDEARGVRREQPIGWGMEVRAVDEGR